LLGNGERQRCFFLSTFFFSLFLSLGFGLFLARQKTSTFYRPQSHTRGQRQKERAGVNKRERERESSKRKEEKRAF
jgi:hypothetical protein